MGNTERPLAESDPPAAREVYRPRGFRDGWSFTRWRGDASGAAVGSARARLLEERDRRSLLELDARGFGRDRAPLLERLRRRSSQFARVVEENDMLRGFLLEREGRVAEVRERSHVYLRARRKNGHMAWASPGS